MTAPRPYRVKEEVASMVQLLEELEETYRWAHGVAHAQTVGDEVKVATGTSDPLGSILLSKRGTRRACEEAERSLADATKTINGAIQRLNRALHLSDPKPRFEPLRYKADATRADIADAHAAQSRRRQRGEAVPE